MVDDLQIQHNLQGIGEFVSVVCRGGEAIATMKGPDREANARLFVHAGELVDLIKQISFFKVDGDDEFIRISVCGVEIGRVSNDSPASIALIKFDAEQRNIFAKIDGSVK